MYYLTYMKYTLPALLISIFLFPACRSFKAPDFRGVGNVGVAKAGLRATTLNLQLLFYNPNNVKAKITGGNGHIWLDNTDLGDFLLDTTVSVPARAEFSVPVKLNVEMKKILQNTFQALFSDSLAIRLAGEARVGKSGVYKKIPLEYKGKISLNQLMTNDTLRVRL